MQTGAESRNALELQGNPASTESSQVHLTGGCHRVRKVETLETFKNLSSIFAIGRLHLGGEYICLKVRPSIVYVMFCVEDELWICR